MKIRLKKMVTFLCTLTIVAVLYSIFYSITGMGIPCLFRLKTGLMCPSCGITRMFVSMFDLDFKSAFEYNRLMFVLLPFFVYYTIKGCCDYVRYGTIIMKKADNIIFYAVIAIMIIFGIVRNVM